MGLQTSTHARSAHTCKCTSHIATSNKTQLHTQFGLLTTVIARIGQLGLSMRTSIKRISGGNLLKSKGAVDAATALGLRNTNMGKTQRPVRDFSSSFFNEHMHVHVSVRVRVLS